MATNSYVQVPPDSTGKKLYTQQHTVGLDTVQGQVLHVGDPDTPENLQEVDFRGAASVRFSEGSPLSDAFGNLKTSNRVLIGAYDYVNDSYDSLYSDAVAGTGSITHLPTYSTIELSVGSAGGDSASRTTNKYHFYAPGTSNLTMMTVALSDAGRTGCRRSWGLFDDNDGAFFNLNETQELGVVVRNSTSGISIENYVSRANWNGDKVDGTGRSGFNIDVTKVNIYWIDYQWLGAGRVRFGVMDSYGNRIVCHTMLNANNNLYPYMRSGSLPLRISIENTAATGGSSNIRLTCSSVQSEGGIDYIYWRYKHKINSLSVTTDNVVCLVMKAVNTISAGHNRANAYPEGLNVHVSGGEVKLEVFWDYLDVTSPVWNMDNGSTILGSSSGNFVPTGTEYSPIGYFLDSGVHQLNLAEHFNKNDMGLCANANEQTPQYVLVLAHKLSGNPIIQGYLNYAEVG